MLEQRPPEVPAVNLELNVEDGRVGTVPKLCLLALKEGWRGHFLRFGSSAVKVLPYPFIMSVAAWKNMKCSFQINHPTSAGSLSEENRRGFIRLTTSPAKGKRRGPIWLSRESLLGKNVKLKERNDRMYFE